MPRSYHTKQKDEILQVIKQKGDTHFTAEEIAVSLKNAGSTIGLSTVYRQLDTMVKEGTLRKYLSSAGESACYQVSESCRRAFSFKMRSLRKTGASCLFSFGWNQGACDPGARLFD